MKYIGNTTWFVGLAAAILLSQSVPALGANVNWNVAGPADWTQDGNWNPTIAPEASFDDVAVIGNSGVAEINKTVTDVVGLQIPNGTVEILQGGALAVLDSASIGRSGTLRLSGNGKFDTGSLGGSGQVELIGNEVSFNVAEDYTLGNLKFDIASDGNPTVVVGGVANLKGIVTPNFANDVTVGFGDSWDFLTADSISGNPDVVPSGALEPGLKLQVSASNGTAALTVGNVPVLSVDRVSGQASIKNVVGADIDMAGYSIGSASGLLNPTSWTSLKSKAIDGWTEANPREQRLAELNLSGQIGLAVGDSIDLGAAYNASRGANPREEDVTFEFVASDGAVADGAIEFTGPANDLVLLVDPTSGEADLRHRSQFIDPFDITYYSILSDGGSLSVEGWNGFADSGAAGDGWTEANPRNVALAELNLSNSHIFSNGTIISLGSIFTAGSPQDLKLEFGTTDGQILVGTVEYGSLEIMVGGFDCDGNGVIDILDANCTSAAEIDNFLNANGFIKGDADGNGAVEFADFLTLSTNFNQTADYTEGDFDKGGTVAFADFLVLSANFGAQAGIASSVPEPTSWALLGLTSGALALNYRRRRISSSL